MLVIRLTRKGKKNQPFFRVVVIDKRRSSKGGRAVDDLGYKNPLTKKISINKEKALRWIKNGAQPSATVHNLFVAEKIIEAKKIKNSNLSKKMRAEKAKTSAAPKPGELGAPAGAPSSSAAGAVSEPSAEAPKEEPKPAQ